MTLDFSLPDLPSGPDPGSRLVLWRAFSPPCGDDRVWLRAVMITSLDGAATVDGLSGGLGTPADGVLYRLLRARADVILVGAATAISEDYGPHEVSDEFSVLRDRPAPDVVLLARTDIPAAIAHCSRRGPAGMAVAAARPTPSDHEAARGAGITLHELGDDLGPGVRGLAERLGAREVSFEGGPRLLSSFFAASLVDELVLSFSPHMVLRGDERRLTTTRGAEPVGMRVHSAFSAPDGGLYTRWFTSDREEAGT